MITKGEENNRWRHLAGLISNKKVTAEWHHNPNLILLDSYKSEKQSVSPIHASRSFYLSKKVRKRVKDKN